MVIKDKPVVLGLVEALIAQPNLVPEENQVNKNMSHLKQVAEQI